MSAREKRCLGGFAAALCVLAGCSGVGEPIAAGADAGLILDATDFEDRDSAAPAKPTIVPPPADAYCEGVEDEEWPERWKADEDRLADLLNALRARPTNADCGAGFSPAPLLARDPALNCMARKRAGDFVAQRDMNERGLPELDFHGSAATGIVAEVSVTASTAEEARARWTASDQAAQRVCRILLDRTCTLVGIGRAQKTWTIEVGGACRPPQSF